MVSTKFQQRVIANLLYCNNVGFTIYGKSMYRYEREYHVAMNFDAVRHQLQPTSDDQFAEYLRQHPGGVEDSVCLEKVGLLEIAQRWLGAPDEAS